MLYAGTIFASALLLFLVQPVMAKSILPWFGGSAGVWATCMLFFQVLLVGGYAYAHWIVRLPPRIQAVIHTALLAVSLALLPISPAAWWKPLAADQPVATILGLLSTSVGLPYLMLAATSPLLQSWYCRERKGTPYRLYALSNLASVAALLAYPFVVEPLLAVRLQRLTWSAAFAAFAVLCVVAAWRGARRRQPDEDGSAAPWRERLVWLALAACPAAMWMAVANQLSESVAPVPFLWILPLTLYLLSFVLCFDREGWYRPEVYRYLLPLGWLAMVVGLAQQASGFAFHWTLLLFCGGLFVCSLFCHGELMRRKPDPRQLTSFYLTIAVGGALGGSFVALLAPSVFKGYYELPVSVVTCILMGLMMVYGYTSPRQMMRLGLVTVAGFAIAVQMRGSLAEDGLRMRNFYGALEVVDGSGPRALRTLYNGAIVHGSQFLALGTGRIPTTYYGPRSGVGLLLSRPGAPRRVGVIGLGAGTLAAYGRAGDYYRFYEINPAVVRLARQKFRYLYECQAKWEIVTGDGRLSLEREPAQNFDVLVLDAFTGDSIPLHLLSREAFVLYLRHLAPGGVLAVHVSNKYLDLVPVLARLTEAAGREATVVRSPADAGGATNDATWVLAGDSGGLPGERVRPARRARLWTDDYSNLLHALK